MTAIAVVPRLGFLGTGWIGRNRMEALARSGAGAVAWVADPDPAVAQDAAGAVGCAQVHASLEEASLDDIDGVVIATPSALHAEQAISLLERGIAVFCQKPLARSATEAHSVVDAARRSDRLLGLDMSYRHVRAFAAARHAVRESSFGRVYAARLWFHNAYGPDKAWFTDPRLSGGGCLMDLGTHLVDLALWTLRWPGVHDVRARLFHEGKTVDARNSVAEDHAVVVIALEDVVVEIECSWYRPSCHDAVIGCSFLSKAHALEVRNVDGSYYDFVADHHHARSAQRLAAPPDDWGGRALCDWAARLARGDGFDPEAEHYVTVAEVIDAAYGRAS